MRVNIFIVGAQRCGTTAWFDYLGGHPDVAVPRIKEPNFFTADMPTARRVSMVDQYHELFPLHPASRSSVDGSTSHLFSVVAAQRIYDYNPEARIVVLLRSPLAFLPSYHAYLHLRGFENTPSFERAWHLEADREQGRMIPSACPHPTLLRYRHLACLGEQLARYVAVFPARQIAVLDFDEWYSDPRRAYLALLHFLQLDDDGRTTFAQVNQALHARSRWLEWALHSSGRLPQTLRSALRRAPLLPGSAWLEQLKKYNREPRPVPPLSGSIADEVTQRLADDQALLDRMADPLRILRR